MAVVIVIRKLSEESEQGPIVYAYKFRPPVSVDADGNHIVAYTNGHASREALIWLHPAPELVASSL